MLRSVHTISSILHTKWMYRHVHTKIWYEYKSRIKPGKEPHAARQLRVSQACSSRTDLLRLLMSAWHYGKENLFLLLLLDFLSWRPKSSWQSGCGTRQWKRDWDWERGLSARVCNRNCTFVLSKRLEWRVQLVMEKVRFPATTQRDVRARLLLERDLVGHNNKLNEKKKVVFLCRYPFYNCVRFLWKLNAGPILKLFRIGHFVQVTNAE